MSLTPIAVVVFVVASLQYRRHYPLKKNAFFFLFIVAAVIALARRFFHVPFLHDYSTAPLMIISAAAMAFMAAARVGRK